MRKAATCLCFVCGLTSCQSNNVFDGRYKYADRPEAIELQGSSMLCDIPGAVDGFVVDSFYVFYTMLNPEYRFAVCDLQTMRPLANLVHVGRGPGEYTYLQCEGRTTCDEDGCGVWFYSGNQQELGRINLPKSLLDRRTSIDHLTPLDERRVLADLGLAGQLFAFDRLADSLAIYQVISQNQVYKGLYDYQNQRAICRYDFDKQSKKEPNLTGGRIFVNPALTKVAFLPVYFNQINICNIDGSDRFSVSTSREPISLEQIERCEPKNRARFYSDAQTTDDQIIALYCGQGQCELHLFDWVGHLLYVFTLDTPVSQISLDPTTGTLYGFVSPEEVYKMNLSPWLRINK